MSKEAQLPSSTDSLAVKRILCATDFSQAATAALEVGVVFAQACNAAIRVAHVCPSPVPSGARIPGMGQRPGADAKSRAQLMESLERCRQRALACGLATHSVLLGGDPAEEIVREAGLMGADLIVMGRHSRGAPDAWTVGSVTERVIKEAPCPVVVARSLPGPRGGSPRHVLCGIDLGQTAAATLAYAAGCASALDGDLLVLHVAAEGRDQGARSAVAALVGKTPRVSRGVRERVVTGVPYQEILAAAREDGSDLVVVGSHGGGFVDRPFIGSTTLHLLRQSECPVLVVPVGVSRRRAQPTPRRLACDTTQTERADVASRLRAWGGRPERRRPSGWWGR